MAIKLPIAVVATIISLTSVCAEAGKCVVTYTFDDGLADQYTIAYPMFRLDEGAERRACAVLCRCDENDWHSCYVNF